MKKILVFLFLTGILGLSMVSAQNFSDNQYQKAGIEYQKQATTAMTAGDYTKAAEQAALASAEFRKSRDYADSQTLMFRAANAINLAQQGINDVEKTARAKTWSKDLASAKDLLKQARSLYTAQKWAESRDKALASLDITSKIPGAVTAPAVVTPSSSTLPLYYVVVQRDRNTDCYWNIAKLPEVYGNPFLWPRLYQANKAKMKAPDNADLIYPGMIIEIPSLHNEKREGTYKAK